MFTGIIEEIGSCIRLQKAGRTGELEVSGEKVLDGLKQGDSLAVQGVCLTVSRISGHRFTMDVSEETLSRSNLGQLNNGSALNLERAVQVRERLGGHIVQGHVDGLAKIDSLTSEGEFYTLRCRVDGSLTRYIVEKGSVSLDGISLTVAKKDEQNGLTVAIIPSTYQATTLQFRRAGDLMNIECDILAKYVESLLSPREGREGLTADALRKHGYI